MRNCIQMKEILIKFDNLELTRKKRTKTLLYIGFYRGN